MKQFFLQDSLVCRGCFRKLEKLVKPKSEVGNLESELETNLKTAVQQHGLISTSSTSSRHGALATNNGEGTPRCHLAVDSRSPQKCQATTEAVSTLPAKRVAVDAPTRRVILQMQPSGDSPAVAVSAASLCTCTQ